MTLNSAIEATYRCHKSINDKHQDAHDFYWSDGDHTLMVRFFIEGESNEYKNHVVRIFNESSCLVALDINPFETYNTKGREYVLLNSLNFKTGDTERIDDFVRYIDWSSKTLTTFNSVLSQLHAHCDDLNKNWRPLVVDMDVFNDADGEVEGTYMHLITQLYANARKEA